MNIDKDTARARATAEPPFSNATEGDGWMGHWCARCAREAFAEHGAGCPLVTLALCGYTPAEWVQPPHEQVFTSSGMDIAEQYHCCEFRPRGGGDRQPRPRPKPDQDGLFERPARGVRMLQQQREVTVDEYLA